MPLRTRRWSDPAEPGDGLRLLVTRYRPRGVRREDATWERWEKDLGPSAELLADFQGKRGAPLPWAEYRRRYLREVGARAALLDELVEFLRPGRTVTLLCAQSCVDPARCHRTLLAELLEKRAARG